MPFGLTAAPRLRLQDDIVETFLIDTSGEQDACLSRDLIRAGHADRRAHAAAASQVSERRILGRGAGLDVRAIADSVRRFGTTGPGPGPGTDSCSASQVRGPARPMRAWSADEPDASDSDASAESASLGGSLARRLAGRPERRAPDDGGSSGESAATATSTATLLSSRVLLRKLRLSEPYDNGTDADVGEPAADGSGSSGSGSAGSATSLSSRLLRRKLQLYDGRGLDH